MYLSKAFDVAERDKLMEKLDQTNLHPNLKRWFLTYLKERKVQFRYQNGFSKWKKSDVGMPQGAVSSPLLYNHFSRDFKVEVAPADVNENFADNNYAASVSSDLNVITETLNQAGAEMVEWVGENGMLISAPKSTVTLFTPWTKKVNAQLDFSIDNVPVPTEKNLRLLGVTLDPMCTFSSHAKIIAKKALSVEEGNGKA